jgi:hypothetical protein
MTTKKHHLVPCLLMSLVILLTACGTTPPPVASNSTPEIQYIVVTATSLPVTDTPDPCASENIKAEVQKVHSHMREFDDASTLAASRPKQELSTSVADLQRIRREAEDQPAPACLATLKNYQISHMNSVINTLVAFMGGADQSTVDQGIALARDQHDKYTIELARLLGITVEPSTSILTPVQTPGP